MSGVREATISSLEGKRLTRHLGRPTTAAAKKTRGEIGAEYAAAKTTHEDFPLGSRFGFAAAVLKPYQFIDAFNSVCELADELDEYWEFDNPERPETTDPTATGNITDATRRRKEANRKELIAQWERFDAYESVYKTKIEEAYDAQYFESLKDDLLGFSHVSVRKMLDHLDHQ